MAFGSSLYKGLFGEPAKLEQFNRFNPQQQQAQQQALSMGLQGLQNPYRGFEGIEQHARNQFNQTTIPSIAERLTSMGGYGTGAASSPAYQAQLGQAGAGLDSSLAALRANYGQQQQGHYRSLLGMGLEPQFQNYELPEQEGAFQQWGPALGQLGMGALAGGLTGGWGAIPGALAAVLQFLAGGQKGKLGQLGSQQPKPG